MRCPKGRWRSTCRRSSRASTSRRGAKSPPTRSPGGWQPMRGAPGGRGFSPTAPRRATWPPAWPSPSAAMRVVVQRTVHGSTIDGLVLAGLEPTFVAPEVDVELGLAHCVLPSALDAALARTPEAAAAIVVSPTYYGAAADVAGLARVAHAHGVPLVVDEAWGAHLAFCDALPQHALAAGADLVISSTHKHAGSLTQSAMLHLGAGGRFAEAGIDRALRLVTSTSPSSLLLASLDAARRHAAVEGGELLRLAVAELAVLRAEICRIRGLEVLDERVVGALRRRGHRSAAGVHRRARDRAERLRGGAADAPRRRRPRRSCAARTSSSRCSGSASVSRSTARASWRPSSARARPRGGRRRWHAPQPHGRTSVVPRPDGAGPTFDRRRRCRRRRGARSRCRRARHSWRRPSGCRSGRPRAGSRRSAWPPIRPASPTCFPVSGSPRRTSPPCSARSSTAAWFAAPPIRRCGRCSSWPIRLRWRRAARDLRLERAVA